MKLIFLGTGCPQVDCDGWARRIVRRGAHPAGRLRLGRHAAAARGGQNGAAARRRVPHASAFGPRRRPVPARDLEWHQGRDRPQRVFGPTGTRRMVDAMLAMWKPEYEQRIAHEKRPRRRARDRGTSSRPKRDAWERRVAVSAVAVAISRSSSPMASSSRRRETAVLQRRHRRLPGARSPPSRGADVLVHECFLHHAMKVDAGRAHRGGRRAVASYHTLSHEVGSVASARRRALPRAQPFRAGEVRSRGLLAEVRRDYDGPISSART